MSVMITRRPENRLAKLIRLPGGKTVGQALADVDAELDKIRDACRESLKAKLAEIQALGSGALQQPDAETADRLYTLSNDILEISGVVGLEQLGHAAFSFCDLLDRLKTRHTWNGPAVQVHLGALTALSEANEVGLTEQQAMVEGLRLVVNRVAR